MVGLLTAINPAYVANFNMQGLQMVNAKSTTFSLPNMKLSGAYGSGIQAGSNVKLTLTAPVANDVIKWKASMPVTISYQ